MTDFRLTSTNSDNLEDYIAKLKKKGFKTEKKYTILKAYLEEV